MNGIEQYYELVGLLGQGTFGRVFRARDRLTERVVAVKQLNERVNSFADGLAVNEVRVLHSLSHPNVIELLEVVWDDGALYLVYELLDANLFDFYSHHRALGRSLTESFIRNALGQLLSALAFLHERGVVHRDVKPENVLLARDGKLKLADFGLAKTADARPPFTSYIATRWYRAPELLLQLECYDSAVDVFALGCLAVS